MELHRALRLGATNLGEAMRRINEGAAMISSKGEAGTGDVSNAEGGSPRSRDDLRQDEPRQTNDVEVCIYDSADRRRIYVHFRGTADDCSDQLGDALAASTVTEPQHLAANPFTQDIRDLMRRARDVLPLMGKSDPPMMSAVIQCSALTLAVTRDGSTGKSHVGPIVALSQ